MALRYCTFDTAVKPTDDKRRIFLPPRRRSVSRMTAQRPSVGRAILDAPEERPSMLQ